MKRLIIVIVVIVGMLAVVAPASAVTLHGTWTGQGTAYGSGGSWPDAGLYWNAEEPLAPTGNLTIAMYPAYTVVASRMIITAGPTVPPFPVKWNTQSFYGWGPAHYANGVYSVDGRIRLVPYVNLGLAFTAHLKADTTTGELTLTVYTNGSSAWGWDSWVLTGELK
jgi:hypothetical protein